MFCVVFVFSCIFQVLEEKKSIPSSSELRRHFGEKLKKSGSSQKRTKGSSAIQGDRGLERPFRKGSSPFVR
jgi:hypothetical protein